MADFATALAHVLKWEGGYQNMKEDSGNYNSRGERVGTNYGISAKAYERWLGRPPKHPDMKRMTIAQAGEVYRNLFWNRIKGDDISSQELANLLFDGHVNHGVTGIHLMQRVLGVKADGIVGPLTLEAINTREPAKVYNQYRQARRDFYHAIVARTPSQKKFLVGWLRRIDSFQDFNTTSDSQQPNVNAATGEPPSNAAPQPNDPPGA